MQISIKFDPRQKAENWVSKVVITGCILITIGLVYLSVKVNNYGQKIAGDKSAEKFLNDL